MRIVGPNRPATTAASAGARRVSGGAVFRLDEAVEPASTAPAAATASIQGVETLLMLQGEDGPQERRRRALNRGHAALDLLDAMKLALLSGDSPLDTVRRLEQAMARQPEATGDPALDRVIGEIDLRVAVELAKHARDAA